MTLSQKVASALSFAHLSGLGRAKSSAKAEDGDEKKGPDEKAKKADGDEPDEDDKEKKKPDAGAEDDDTDSKAAAGDVDEDEDDEKKAKSEGEDDKDDEMRGKSAAAQARLREQARCASIFASPAAARNPVLAANLAFKSRMGRGEALAILEATPAAATAGNTARAARNPNVGAGPGAGASSHQAASASMDRAFLKANPANARRLAK
jgi:hypothetical protein